MEIKGVTSEKLAQHIVDNMDQGELYIYAIDRLTAYFTSLTPEAFRKEAEDEGYHWEDD